jgi:elongation factor P
MLEASQLKAGTTFLYNDNPYRVLKYFHQKIARGGGTVKVNVKNLENGEREELTFKSSQRVEDITTYKKPMKYLYKSKGAGVFMDEATYEQTEISEELIKDELPYIKVGSKVNLLFWEDTPLSIDIPPKVKLKVKQTDPGVKGNSATNIYKPAVLENGISLKVPLFINSGDEVVVDSRTGEYVERSKK